MQEFASPKLLLGTEILLLLFGFRLLCPNGCILKILASISVLVVGCQVMYVPISFGIEDAVLHDFSFNRRC